MEEKHCQEKQSLEGPIEKAEQVLCEIDASIAACQGPLSTHTQELLAMLRQGQNVFARSKELTRYTCVVCEDVCVLVCSCVCVHVCVYMCVWQCHCVRVYVHTGIMTHSLGPHQMSRSFGGKEERGGSSNSRGTNWSG